MHQDLGIARYCERFHATEDQLTGYEHQDLSVYRKFPHQRRSEHPTKHPAKSPASARQSKRVGVPGVSKPLCVPKFTFGTTIAPRGRRDIFQMQEHHVAFLFAKLLELRLGHGFLRVHLQLGQQHVELSTDDLSLFMIRTMKAQ
ncbi:hypothetical protein [Rhizobium multihospitium]|uniref:hypothetical protein n=1 Tax=Rhizobium multihospitium TaxID=410764 RepID=UPI001ABEFD17|nr:hypothetical protein [Rhizobium multihospitium]